MVDIKETVIARDLKPYHSFLAAFFGGLAELGMINQGTINIVSERAAEYMYAYLDARDNLPDLSPDRQPASPESIAGIISHLNQELELLGDYRVRQLEDDQLVLLIAADQCRICPKGVGGAAIKGNFCPIPSFVQGMVNHVLGDRLLQVSKPGIEKEGKACKAYYHIKV